MYDYEDQKGGKKLDDLNLREEVAAGGRRRGGHGGGVEHVEDVVRREGSHVLYEGVLLGVHEKWIW